MNVKSFIDSDQKRLRNRVTQFIKDSTDLDIMNIKYDIGYVKEPGMPNEYRAIVFYIKKKI